MAAIVLVALGVAGPIGQPLDRDPAVVETVVRLARQTIPARVGAAGSGAAGATSEPAGSLEAARATNGA